MGQARAHRRPRLFPSREVPPELLWALGFLSASSFLKIFVFHTPLKKKKKKLLFSCPQKTCFQDYSGMLNTRDMLSSSHSELDKDQVLGSNERVCRCCLSAPSPPPPPALMVSNIFCFSVLLFEHCHPYEWQKHQTLNLLTKLRSGTITPRKFILQQSRILVF